MCFQLQNSYTISTKFEQKSPILAGKSPNSTKILQNSSNSTKNHLIYRIENYIEKWHLMNNEEVGINLH